MIGNLFAGTDESPGELILYQGRSFKEYRGMGSIGAMRRGSRDRYFQDEFDLDAPGGDRQARARRASRDAWRTRAASPASSISSSAACAPAWATAAAGTFRRCSATRRLIRITAAGVRESHVHDVAITKEAPNYRSE